MESIKTVEKALGRVRYGLTADQKKLRVFRRSLFVVKDIKKGETLTEENVRSIRPANGLKPKYLRTILGKKAKKNILRGSPLSLGLVGF